MGADQITDVDLSYAYDNLGRLTQASDPNGHKVIYSYDALGRRLTEGNVFYGTRTSAYDLAGRRTRLTWGDGFYVNYSYLLTGEMSSSGRMERPRAPACWRRSAMTISAGGRG